MKKRSRRRPRLRRYAVSSAAGPLVQKVLKQYGVVREVKEQDVLLAWEQLVGARVAARAWPTGLKDGVLYVEVKNSSWLHQLSLMKEQLLSKIANKSGDSRVQSIRFEIAGRSRLRRAAVDAKVRRPPPIVRKRPLPPPATGQRLAQILSETEAVEDDELREAIEAARRKLDL